MKKLFSQIFLLLLVIPLGTNLFASHEMGVQITYTCTSACTVEVTLKAYRDCTGSNVIGNNLNWIGVTPGCTPPNAVTPFNANAIFEVTPICPSAPTQCTTPGSLINGIEEYGWTRSYDICSGTPCVYRLVWNDCCRNPAITSLVNAGSQSIYTENTLINTTLATCNNSPQYSNLPMFIACNNTDYDVHQGAYDPDGDSLVYSLGDCFQNAGTPVTYQSGFSASIPMGPSWNVSIDSQTGLLHLDANPGNTVVGVICVMLEEYRNGALIATHQRDIQIATMACPNNTNPSFTGITNLSNGYAVGDDIYICSPSAFCFDVESTDPNTSQNITMFWDQNLPGAVFHQVGNPSAVNSFSSSAALPPAGHFCWTPPGVGTYQTRIRVQDDACPVYGITDKVITIHVGSGLGASATATPTTCPSVDFAASICGVGPFTYTWSGAGGLTGTTQNLSHSYSAPGTYAWQVIVSNGSISDTVTGNVVVGGSPSQASLLSGVSFVAPCVGYLYDTLFGPSGYSSYAWSNGATTQDQIVAIGGIYHLTVSDAIGCTFTDSTELYWAAPDIYGFVEASTGAPLQNQKIYLIEHDTMTQSLFAVDSVWTDSSGYYFFCNVTDTNVFLKAAPLIFDYPNEMPTYADTTLFWNNAIEFYPLSMSPFQHDFSTLFGTNPGGPGFIGGLISQGANKTNGVGDPVPNVRIFLRDRNSGNYLGSRVSNAAGYFSFSNIPLGDYEFAVDVPNVDQMNVPQLRLDNQHQSYDSLDFRLHSTYLELVMPTVAISPALQGYNFAAIPNPFGSKTTLQLTIDVEKEVELLLFDAFGRQIEVLENRHLNAGQYRFDIGNALPNGIYFAKLSIGGNSQTIKLLKMD